VEVVRKIADIKGVPVEEVAQATSMNAMEVFSISPEG
jgi:Tat protein secretion system quality control protein TatD with DNase activity